MVRKQVFRNQDIQRIRNRVTVIGTTKPRVEEVESDEEGCVCDTSDGFSLVSYEVIVPDIKGFKHGNKYVEDRRRWRLSDE